MALGEFELIKKFFSSSAQRGDVVLGVGDDAALVSVPAGYELAVAADTIVSGIHFPAGLESSLVGYRALAVNLSDIAAMGAEPSWFTLCLTLPEADERWLSGFSRGLLTLAAQHNVALVGGDTTAGPLAVAVQILGCVPAGTAIRRSGAQVGDVVCLSGTIGDASGGLRILQEGGERADDCMDAGGTSPRTDEVERRRKPKPGATQGAVADDEHSLYLMERFLHPTPRVELGKMLRGVATSAIDISDGLSADVAKVAEASAVAIRLQVDKLPISSALLHRYGTETARRYALGGGDDYELCFTVPSERLDEVRRQAQSQGQAIHCIGVVEKGRGVSGSIGGQAVDLDSAGYDHFQQR